MDPLRVGRPRGLSRSLEPDRDRATPGRGSRGRSAPAVVMVLCALGCGGSDTSGPGGGGPTDPGPLAPLVGLWEATEFTHVNRVDPTITVDLIAQGATFRLSVQASGTYQTTGMRNGQTQSESGLLRLDGTELLVIEQVPGPPDTARVTWSVQGSQMTWDGRSEFDFNFDGSPEATDLRIVFRKN